MKRGLLFLGTASLIAGLAACTSPTGVARNRPGLFLDPKAVPQNVSGLSADEVERARKLHVAKCARCHRPYNPAAYPAAGWDSWMGRMSRKARLKPEEQDLLSRYLDGFRASQLEEQPVPVKEP